MNKHCCHIVLGGLLCAMLYSCSARTISGAYYLQNRRQLDSIEQTYRALYNQQPFSLSYTDRGFRTMSLEIVTDSLTYIYDFRFGEKRFVDTLIKYHLDDQGMFSLASIMQSIHCTWVNNLDYYTDGQKRSLIFISVKSVSRHPFFNTGKYYILTYYSQPQYFDAEGRLLDKRKQRRLRRINGDIFHRITDKVCYTVSGQYR